MILGMSLSTFTTLHVAISLIGIGTGFVAAFGMIGARRLPLWTEVFLSTTALTSITGFFFPFKGITPGIVIGILSLVVLAVAAVARYARGLAGAWRGTYVISAMLALYFNFFVLIVQSFEKAPALKALAATQGAAPFKVTQLVTLIVFATLTTLAMRRFHVAPAEA
jgi:magnesium-transporting ATPase (P-type)